MQIRFGPFLLDLETRQLTRDGADHHLSPKAFDLLALLIEDRPKVISKSALQQRLWPDTFVAEANLSNLVAEIRTALDDSPQAAAYIRTAHRIGYAFCGSAIAQAARPSAAPCPVGWIEWGTRRFPLYPGEHVVGRDPGVEIRLDATSVSRRHARVIVTADGARLEDVDSKNGTWRGGDRLTSPTALADGDQIRIGSQLVTFRLRGSDTTETHAGVIV